MWRASLNNVIRWLWLNNVTRWPPTLRMRTTIRGLLALATATLASISHTGRDLANLQSSNNRNYLLIIANMPSYLIFTLVEIAFKSPYLQVMIGWYFKIFWFKFSTLICWSRYFFFNFSSTESKISNFQTLNTKSNLNEN